MLTGGGALLGNLDNVLRHATGLPVSIGDEPLSLCRAWHRPGARGQEDAEARPLQPVRLRTCGCDVTGDGSRVDGDMLKSALSMAHALQRFAFPLFAGLAIGLMILSRIENPAVARLRAEAVDVLAPVIDAMSRPVAAVQTRSPARTTSSTSTRKTQRLRDENSRLLTLAGDGARAGRREPRAARPAVDRGRAARRLRHRAHHRHERRQPSSTPRSSTPGAATASPSARPSLRPRA